MGGEEEGVVGGEEDEGDEEEGEEEGEGEGEDEETTTTDPHLHELKTQLEELSLASSQTESRLLSEIASLRSKKTLEDNSRHDLKSRLKSLEDSKRFAEVRKHDAEKVLVEKNRGVREVEERVGRVREEVEKRERREREGREKKEKKKRDRRERVERLREERVKKEDELRGVEGGKEGVQGRVEEIRRVLEERRMVLEGLRKERLGAGGFYGRRGFTPNSSRPQSVRSMDAQHSPPQSQHPSSQGFFEHRVSHRHDHPLPSTTSTEFVSASTDFHPFDFDSHQTSLSTRPKLSLPLQYLDSGLLERGVDSAELGPLSPMTPSQASLIPSQLFELLDGEDDDLPDSPTRGSARLNSGLGLDLIDSISIGGRRDQVKRDHSLSPITSTSTAPTSPLTPNNLASASSSPWDDFSTTSKPSPTWIPDDLPRHGLSLNPDAKAFAFQPRSSGESASPPQVNTPVGVTAAIAVGRGASFDWKKSGGGFDPFGGEDELLGPLK